MNLTARPIAQKEPRIKVKKCANKDCRASFTPDRPFITWCSPECGTVIANAKIAHQNALRAKKERKEYKDAKEKQKSRRDWLREAQQVFNSYIRARDEGKPCISCGSHTGKKNAGHYLSVGSCPELRFEPLNVHLQCEKCNSYLSANLIKYRIELFSRIGKDGVEYLEGPHQPKKYSLEDLKSIKALYKSKLKELEKR